MPWMPAMRITSRSLTSRALFASPQLPEEAPHLPDEQLRLLEGCEMAALGHLAPVLDVGKGLIHPLPHRRHNLLGEDCDTGRHHHLIGARAAKAFPIEPRG